MKAFLPLLALTLGSISGVAQSAMPFNTYYHPGMEYHIRLRQYTENVNNFEGSSRAVLDKVLASGMAKSRTDSTVIESVTTTGKLGKDNRFPIEVDYSHAFTTTKDPDLTGVRAYGIAPVNQAPVFAHADHVKNDSVVLAYINQMFTQALFSDQTAIQGKPFEVIKVVDVPFGSAVLHTRYLFRMILQDHVGDIAHFVMKLVLDLDPNQKEPSFPVTYTGTGTGSITFNARLQYIEYMHVQYQAAINVRNGGLVWTMTGSASSDETCHARTIL